MKTIKLSNYKIHFGDIWQKLNRQLLKKKYSDYFIIVDKNTDKFCLPVFEKNISIENIKKIKIPSGEKHKNLKTAEIIWKKMMQVGAGRDILVINLGGGVIGDMGGFCASTFKRGVDFIQIPTTLLSQVDASIGGKLGIDFHDIKNGIGLFGNPNAVFINLEFLKTLSKRQIKSGFAEMIKHTLIADLKEWKKLKKIKSLSPEKLEKHIFNSLKIKKRTVEADPYEKGLRKILNFGHTIGHAVESLSLKTELPLLHGEAVAVGMICEAYISFKSSGLKEKNLMEITKFLIKIFGKTNLNKIDFPYLIELMKNDKKNIGKDINFTLLKSIGNPVINQKASNKLITESFVFYNNF